MQEIVYFNKITELMESLEGEVFTDPFPHLIIKNYYNSKELELLWEELNFYTKPGKLLPAEKYGGIKGYTEAKAISLDALYIDRSPNGGANFRNISDILTVSRKLFTSGILDEFSKIHDCCSLASKTNNDFTKDTTPFEVGLGRFVDFNKEDFINKVATQNASVE